MANRLADISLDLIYTSDLGRACNTAERIAARQHREVPVMMMPELRECNYGLWEGLTRPEVAGRFPGDWTNWAEGKGIERPTGGEDFPSLARRAGSVFDAAVREGKTILISAHLGPLRAILCHALGIEPILRNRFFVANCSLSALECRPEHQPRLMFLNDTCHLHDV